MKLRNLVSWVMLGAASCVACGGNTTSDDAEMDATVVSGAADVGSGGASNDGGNAAPATSVGGTGGSAGGAGGAQDGGGGERIVPAEAPACDEGEAVDLSPEDTAERLAQLFWRQSAPESLLDAAAQDGLKTTGAVACFAREMLQDARADEGIGDFFEGWLEIGKGDEPQQDPEYVPELTPELVDVAHVEAVRFALKIGEARTAL